MSAQSGLVAIYSNSSSINRDKYKYNNDFERECCRLQMMRMMPGIEYLVRYHTRISPELYCSVNTICRYIRTRYVRRHYNIKSYANTYRRRTAHGNSSRPSASFKAFISAPQLAKQTQRQASEHTTPPPNPCSTSDTPLRTEQPRPKGDTKITRAACLCFCDAGLGDLTLVCEREGRVGEACRSTGSGLIGSEH